MANDNNTKIEETTLTVGNRRIVISEDGIWVDSLRDDGTVASSVALAWEELSTREEDSYKSLYERVRGGNQPEFRKAG